jgi:hypothetical protein
VRRSATALRIEEMQSNHTELELHCGTAHAREMAAMPPTFAFALFGDCLRVRAHIRLAMRARHRWRSGISMSRPITRALTLIINGTL